MANGRDSHEDGVSRRHALEFMDGAGTGILWVSGGAPESLSLLGRAEAAPVLLLSASKSKLAVPKTS